MKRRTSARRRGASLLLAALLCALIGCRPVQPGTATVAPGATPDDMAVYRMLTDKYTSAYAVLRVPDLSADDAARILRALQAVSVPPEAEALHEQALDAYRHICTGKLLLPGADSRLRAEAYFMVDWGISRLIDYGEQLDRMCQPQVGD